MTRRVHDASASYSNVSNIDVVSDNLRRYELLNAMAAVSYTVSKLHGSPWYHESSHKARSTVLEESHSSSKLPSRWIIESLRRFDRVDALTLAGKGLETDVTALISVWWFQWPLSNVNNVPNASLSMYVF